MAIQHGAQLHVISFIWKNLGTDLSSATNQSHTGLTMSTCGFSSCSLITRDAEVAMREFAETVTGPQGCQAAGVSGVLATFVDIVVLPVTFLSCKSLLGTRTCHTGTRPGACDGYTGGSVGAD